MIDIRGGIYQLLSTLSTPVFQTRLDPFKAEKLPAITIQYNRVHREQIADNLTYKVIAGVQIIILVAKTDGYDSQLDSIVNDVLNKLLTDPTWDTQFEYVGGIDVQYDYGQGGDVNVATAVINLNLQFTEVFDPNITSHLNKVHFDIDFIAPAADPNLHYPGPDTRIEAQLDVSP